MCTSSASSDAAMMTKLGQAAEIGVVETSRMSSGHRADKAGAIDREAQRQALDRTSWTILAYTTLQERRIDRAERLVALGRKTRCKRHRMLLGEPTSKVRSGKPVENVDPVPDGIRRGDAESFRPSLLP